MLCKVAELYFQVPDVEGLALHCQDYRWDGEPDGPVYTMREDLYTWERWTNCTEEMVHYLETGHQFAIELVRHSGIRVHSSAIAWQGRAFLFSGPCGMGKSTHGKMWQQLYGDAITIINDDKPALRLLGDRWYAYGTPWCGKDHINTNVKVPLGGICFLEQAPENRIRRLDSKEALSRILTQTLWRWMNPEELDLHLGLLDKLFRRIPVYLLECTPTTDAAKLSSETMLQGAIDAGL